MKQCPKAQRTFLGRRVGHQALKTPSPSGPLQQNRASRIHPTTDSRQCEGRRGWDLVAGQRLTFEAPGSLAMAWRGQGVGAEWRWRDRDLGKGMSGGIVRGDWSWRATNADKECSITTVRREGNAAMLPEGQEMGAASTKDPLHVHQAVTWLAETGPAPFVAGAWGSVGCNQGITRGRVGDQPAQQQFYCLWQVHLAENFL